jgi:hypothetical protein
MMCTWAIVIGTFPYELCTVTALPLGLQINTGYGASYLEVVWPFANFWDWELEQFSLSFLLSHHQQKRKRNSSTGLRRRVVLFVSVGRCFLNVWFLSSIDVCTMDILRHHLMSLHQYMLCSFDDTRVYKIRYVFVNSVNPSTLLQGKYKVISDLNMGDWIWRCDKVSLHFSCKTSWKTKSLGNRMRGLTQKNNLQVG